MYVCMCIRICMCMNIPTCISVLHKYLHINFTFSLFLFHVTTRCCNEGCDKNLSHHLSKENEAKEKRREDERLKE